MATGTGYGGLAKFEVGILRLCLEPFPFTMPKQVSRTVRGCLYSEQKSDQENSFPFPVAEAIDDLVSP
jgi:hypothetical protein